MAMPRPPKTLRSRICGLGGWWAAWRLRCDGFGNRCGRAVFNGAAFAALGL